MEESALWKLNKVGFLGNRVFLTHIPPPVLPFVDQPWAGIRGLVTEAVRASMTLGTFKSKPEPQGKTAAWDCF